MATQFGTLLKDVLRRYLLKRAVVSELRQVHEESRRVWTSLARSLQIHALGGVDKALPLPLSNRVCGALRRGAAGVHPGVQEFDAQGLERFGLRLQAVMGNAAETLWLTNYYAPRPDFPVLEHDSPERETYQQYVDSYRDEFKIIIASVEGLTRKDFERAYRPARPPDPEPEPGQVQSTNPSPPLPDRGSSPPNR